MGKYFYCYSIQLKNFLKLRGLTYEKRERHVNGNYYWMFVFTPELKNELENWNRYKKIFKEGE